MKSAIVKSSLFLLMLALLATSADAQRASRRRNAAAGGGQQPADNQQEQNNNTAAPSGYNPYGNIPIIVDKAEGTDDSVIRKSMRPDAAFDKTFINERTPLPYEHLRWDDALFAEKVWRELDLREKLNMPFRYQAEDDNGDQRFISILLKAVRSGEITAFSDDRFTTPMDSAGVTGITAGG
ncbi:MAG TPA: hypothetical protein VEZ55_03595, partial [Chitinophagaceae bacterium]|nr:hypothetical protein [Chitinophagaceae bacterium]